MDPVPAVTDLVPTDLDLGTMGPDRNRLAWRFVQDIYLSNPIPLPKRVAFLCAAWENADGRSTSIHASGITLLGQSEQLIDLGAEWRAMAQDRATRRVLRATMDLGQGRTVPPSVLHEVHDTLGRWLGPWQDLLAMASWYDLLHRANLASAFAHCDPRLDDWLGRIVEAGRYLPRNYE